MCVCLYKCVSLGVCVRLFVYDCVCLCMFECLRMVMFVCECLRMIGDDVKRVIVCV